jgi:hypothetical protein
MKQLAIFIAIMGVLLGLIASLFVVYEVGGAWGVFVGLLLFPLTLAYLPFYTLLTDGNWNLLLFNYGSITLSWILLSIAEKQKQKPPLATDEPPTQPVVTKDNPSPAVVVMVIGGVILAAILCALLLRVI